MKRLRAWSTLLGAGLWGCSAEPFAAATAQAPDRPASGEWVEVLPDGDTACSDGSPFRFYARGGRTDRIQLYFQGGGACWNAATCAARGTIYFDTAPSLDAFLNDYERGVKAGVYRARDPEILFGDWTFVYIPYCSGDIHWGNARKDYGDGLTIEHRGYANASAALEWLYARYPEPSHVVVSGTSAGAYGAVLHSAYVARHYGDAHVAVLADSGSGILTDEFLRESLPNWNAQPALPSFVPALDRPITELSLVDVYRGVGAAFPDLALAQTATQFDNDQIFYFTAMGGTPSDWPARFRSSLSDIERDTPNFRYYVPPGSMHGALPYAFFDTREVKGVKLRDFTEELALGESLPDSVACNGAECCADPICDACKDGDYTVRPCIYCRPRGASAPRSERDSSVRPVRVPYLELLPVADHGEGPDAFDLLADAGRCDGVARFRRLGRAAERVLELNDAA